MAGESKTTIDHEVIKKWAEERGAKPSVVKDTGKTGQGAGVLRFDFGEKNSRLEEISWDDFFKTFDGKNLAFLYQNEVKDGKPSRFFKFISRDSMNR